MSSSTSSSKVYLKIFLAVTLGMGAALVLVRLFAWANDASGDTILSRVNEARQALPQIVEEPDDLVMAFGSSMTHAGFASRHFDNEVAKQGVRVKSFNFGFGGLNPFFQDYLSRRIRDAFQEKDRRLKLAMIEFVPFQATGNRWQGAQPVVDSFLTMLASPEEIWEITKEDPERGFQMLNILYLRDGISAEMVTHFFGRSLMEREPRSDTPEDEEAVKRRRELGDRLGELFEAEFPDYEDQDWYYPWQGAGPLREERSEETLTIFPQYYEAGRTQRRMENDRLNRISCCDIEELQFEEELVAGFIRVVENFKDFSDHVEVVLYPRNTKWIDYSPEAQQRLDEVLDRIRRETGVTIRNYQLLESITPDMYSDTTHLGRYVGEMVFTEHLAKEYAPLLADGN